MTANQVSLQQIQATINEMDDNLGIVTHEASVHEGDVSEKLDAIPTSVFSLRTLGEQISRFIGTFRREICERLQVISQADWKTYQTILQVRNCISRSPTSLQNSNIQFTNVLGEHRSLPYDYFCHW